MDNTDKNAKAEEVVKLETEKIDSSVSKNEEEIIDYPVSELIKNAPKLTNSWG